MSPGAKNMKTGPGALDTAQNGSGSPCYLIMVITGGIDYCFLRIVS
jgi:hypothetical protein